MKKIIFTFLFFIVSVMSSAVVIQAVPALEDGCSGLQLSLDPSQGIWPGYYQLPDLTYPEDGYSYFWMTDEGTISTAESPVMFFSSLGTHSITLILTPRKKPLEPHKTTFVGNVSVGVISPCLNSDYSDSGIMFDSEAKKDRELYVILPLALCENEALLYEFDYDPSFFSYSKVLDTSFFDLGSVEHSGSTVSFSKNWMGSPRNDAVAVIELIPIGEDTDIGVFTFRTKSGVINLCTEPETASIMISVGPYDPNYKASDIWKISTGSDVDAEVDSTDVVYTIHFQNIGEGPVDSVTILDILPSYLTYVSTEASSHPITSFTGSGQEVTWVLGNNTTAKLDIPGTNRTISPPIDSTKGWVRFKAKISPVNDIDDSTDFIASDTCYCLCNQAAIWFEDLAPILTSPNIIAIGNKLCFRKSVNSAGEVTVWSETKCRDSSSYNKESAGVLRIHNSYKGIDLYPNPASQSFSISNGLTQRMEVTIIDGLGRVVIQEVYNDKVMVDHLPNGLYFIEVKKNNNTYFSKLIKN